MQPPVPAVEVADDADRARVRRPHGEGRAGDAVDLARRARRAARTAARGGPRATRCRSSSPSVGRNEYGSRSVYVFAVRVARPRARSRAAASPSAAAPSKSPAGSFSSASTCAVGWHAHRLAPPAGSARTTTPPFAWCAPSDRVRVRRRARSRRRRSPARAAAGSPATGIADPVGAVVELVAQLVDRLLELEDRRAAGRSPRWPAGSSDAVDRREVAVEELLAGARLPAVRRPRRRAAAGARGRVRERAQHPGDVAQRRALAPALGERAAPARPRSR